MARTVGIDRDEVFETANRLEAEGKEVTALSMLAALGRGSLTTIYKYLDAWKESKPVKNPIVQVEQPEDAREVLVRRQQELLGRVMPSRSARGARRVATAAPPHFFLFKSLSPFPCSPVVVVAVAVVVAGC